MEKTKVVNYVFLTLICVCIVIFSFAVFTLIENIDLIKKDPINYGMEKNHFYSCVCYSELGTIFYNMDEKDYLTRSDAFKNQTMKKESYNISLKLGE